jgi:hypothetical protein
VVSPPAGGEGRQFGNAASDQAEGNGDKEGEGKDPAGFGFHHRPQ